MTQVPTRELQLPPGFTARPAVMDDVAAATALFNACEVQQMGRPQTDTDDIRHEWESSVGFNLQTDTLLIYSPDGLLAGYGEVWDRAPHVVIYTWGRTHPDFQGQGVGTSLVAWCEQRARASVGLAPEGARVVVRQGVPGSDTAAHALLESQGYSRARQFYRMKIEMQGAPPEPQLPAGLGITTFEQHGDLAAVIEADQDAFRDHWGFVLRPMELELQEWRSRIQNDPHFDPSLWFLAVAGEEVAGICLCSPHMTEDPDMGWINILGVRRPWRRRGLALALLYHAFGVFYRRGKTRVALGVDADSLTGATRLYEKAGMHVEQYNYTYEKELRPGEDPSTQTLS